jgi:hypothetical protein
MATLNDEAWAATRTIEETGPLWATVWGADVAAPTQTTGALSPA